MRASHVVVPFRSQRTRHDEVMHRLASERRTFVDGDNWATRACSAFESLGPVFGAFAAYMGSRIDLLFSAECQQLSRASRIARIRPPEAVRELLSRVAAYRDRQIVDVDLVPLSVSTVTQAHRGRLADGRVVKVELLAVTPEASAEDLELLEQSEVVFAPRVGVAAFRSAIADFRLRFREAGDLVARLALLQRAEHDIASGAPLCVPHPYSELSSSRVIVTDIAGDERWTVLGGRGGAYARRIDACNAISSWLRQALFGSVCPLFEYGEPVALHGERLVASSFVRLPGATQQHLLTYLFGVAGEAPDRAWLALKPELVTAIGAQPGDEVQRAFRRLVPFRDNHDVASGSTFADHVFLQWRTASQHGWLPASHMVPFYQGLFALTSAVQDTQSEGDLLAEAVGALRLPADVRQVGAWAADADMLLAMERQMALLMELPQKFDRLLTAAADGTVRVQLVTADGPRASRSNRAAAMIALLLIAASMIVLAGAIPWVQDAWGSEPWRSLALVATGVALVWAVGRFR